MSPARALVALPLAAALLAGCGADPAAERRDLVAELTQAANDGDADAVREHAEALVQVVADQREREELSAEQADRLIALAESVRKHADVVDADLQARLEAEAEAEAARKALEETQRRLEVERRKAEEAARQAEEDRKKDEGKGDDGEGDKKDEGKGDD